MKSKFISLQLGSALLVLLSTSAHAKEAAFEDAFEAYRLEHFEDARQELLGVLEEDPSDINALSLLAIMEIEGQFEGAEKDRGQAQLAEHFPALLERATSSDVYSNYLVADVYISEYLEFGDEVDPDEEGIQYLNQGVEQKFPASLNAMGLLYDLGEGVEIDDVKAVEFYREAAELGFAPSAHNLALMYEFAEGVEQNFGEAVKWYGVAIEQDYPRSLNNLAMLYQEGSGVEVDLEKAVELLHQAEKYDRRVTYANLAEVYDFGRGVRIDKEKAAYYHDKAARRGDVESQYELGMKYAEGEGVEPDDGKALFWAYVARENESENAQALVSVLEKRMPEKTAEGLLNDATTYISSDYTQFPI